jgi:hypothetical protein
MNCVAQTGMLCGLKFSVILCEAKNNSDVFNYIVYKVGWPDFENKNMGHLSMTDIMRKKN